jgi:hypothetical protein
MPATAAITRKRRPVDATGRLGWCALAAGLVHGWSSPSAPAAPVRLSVPFRTDQSITASTMAMEWQAEDLGGRPVSEALQASAHPSTGTLKLLIDHLAAGRTQAAAALLKPGAFQSAEDAQSYANNFVAAFQNALPQAMLRRRFDVGGESWFSWELPLDGKPVNRVTRFSEQAGSWLWADELRPSTTRSMQSLLSAAEQLLAENQPGARAVESMEFQHAVPVPGLPARWMFNGFSTSWDAFGNGPVPDHPVTRAYASAVRSLYQGDFEAYAAAHLPFSAQRLRESVASMDNQQKAAFAESVRREGRKVTFVLDATPIFLVFYETDGRGLQYDTLLAPGDGSPVRLCNFFFEGFIDEILKDRGFFHDPVIRPIAGRLQDPTSLPPGTTTPAPGVTTTPGAPAADPPAPVPSPADHTNPPSSEPKRLPKPAWLGLLIILALLAALVLRLRRSQP